jgi:leucine-zipper-like transcriptional regulator 1
MGNKLNSPNPEDLRVLNDVRFFDTSTQHWLPSDLSSPKSDADSESFVPKARYAHLSSITANRLFIIGGQDLSNVWLDDIHVYDLQGKTWIQQRVYPRHSGTYRSVAVSSDKCVRIPQGEQHASSSPSKPDASGSRSNQPLPNDTDPIISDSLVHLPYSTEPTEEYPSNIYIYSNYNVCIL